MVSWNCQFSLIRKSASGRSMANRNKNYPDQDRSKVPLKSSNLFTPLPHFHPFLITATTVIVVYPQLIISFPPSCGRLHSSTQTFISFVHILEYTRGGLVGILAADWFVNLHMDPETREVYLVRVWDRLRTVNAIFVDARTSEPIISPCAELYSIWLSIDSLIICCGEYTPTDYYAFDDVRLFLSQGRDHIAKDWTKPKRRRFQDKKAAK